MTKVNSGTAARWALAQIRFGRFFRGGGRGGSWGLGSFVLGSLLLALGAVGIAAAQPDDVEETGSGFEGALPVDPVTGQPTEIDFEITKGFTKTSVLVREFDYDGAQRRLLARGESPEQVLAQDLEFSDFFSVQREDGRRGTPAETVVYARVVSRFGKVVLQGQLLESATGDVIFESEYPLGDPPDRWALHAFSDDVVLYLTGEAGVASTRIAFVGNATGSKEVYLVDYDGARLSRVTSLGSITISPAWSAEGKYIACTTFASGNPDLAKIEVGDPEVVAISTRQGINSAPEWDPAGSGDIIAALSYEGNTELYRMNSNGGDLHRLTFEPNSIETSATFSPSGGQIAFVSDRTGQTQIYIMDADGANVRRLTYLNGYCDSPDWSPKGDSIVFVGRVDGAFDLFTMAADGTNLRRLSSGEGNHENPSWAADGRHIVYAKRDGNDRRLFITAADGSGKRQLTWSRGDQYNPAWSPPLR